jgi:hypothetical protein
MTQKPPRHGNRHAFQLLLALVDQGVAILPYKLCVIPLRIGNLAPRGQSVQQINRFGIGVPSRALVPPGSGFEFRKQADDVCAFQVL